MANACPCGYSPARGRRAGRDRVRGASASPGAAGASSSASNLELSTRRDASRWSAGAAPARARSSSSSTGCSCRTRARSVSRARVTTEWDPFDLRRHIGYVLQEIGLFPHMTVAENVAVVPRLLGWDGARIGARVRELLDLAGLGGSDFASRRPHRAVGRPAAARRRGARAGRRPADPADGRAVRRARSDHARRDARRVPAHPGGRSARRSSS